MVLLLGPLGSVVITWSGGSVDGALFRVVVWVCLEGAGRAGPMAGSTSHLGSNYVHRQHADRPGCSRGGSGVWEEGYARIFII